MAAAAIPAMKTTPAKPYEISPRVFLFACDVIHAFPRTHLNFPAQKVWSQLIASATSTGAHLEEASAGGSRAHFLALTRGALREMRESHYWLRLMIATEVTGFEAARPMVHESRELVAILATIVRHTYENAGPARNK
jgi:four helix bundle protein